MLQFASNTRRIVRVLTKSPPISVGIQSLNADEITHNPLPFRAQYPRHFTSQYSGNDIVNQTGKGFAGGKVFALSDQCNVFEQSTRSIWMQRASFCSGACGIEGKPTDAVKDYYDKIIKSVKEKRTAPQNGWLWSLVENCSNREDIKLLFNVLETLRRFRLSNLRIHENFNCTLCREITKACTRVGAIDFGKKALWKHNVYGLTPSVGSANHLLMYAKKSNDASLMVEVMKLIKKNDLELQPGVADIVLNICYNADKWDLLTKYAKRFICAGVKLRQTSFDVWMEFATKIGDVDSLWRTEKLRSDSMKKHSLATGFSCAKGFLLERKPENAAAIIQVLNQTLSDAKRPGIMVELQKLVSEWPLEIIKRQKEEDRKALAAALQADIPAMVKCLIDLGLEANVDTDDLVKKDLLC